ncbi:MAG: type II toxin-antitoxin system RelE/ParE family toxin [SAR324 cluster bacterium]|nr:type II toxin-antitoxin system RelE/ParE family toxin [SAR324 cluster bacterium]
MIIIFKTKKFQKICNNYKLSEREFGTDQARKLRQRLDELHAAETLEDVSYLPPPRCHELSHNLKGKFSVDLKHPYRLIFEPAEEPVPLKENGGIVKSKVRSMQIINVEDTHGK